MWDMRAESHFGRVMRCFAERPLHVDALLRASAARVPDAIALVHGERRVSYAELDARVERIAGNLHAAGVGHGARVAALLDNGVEQVEIMLACARLGAIFVPLNIRQRRPEIAYALRDSGALLLIHEASLAAELPERAELPAMAAYYVLDGETPGSLPYEALLAPAAAPAVAVAQDDPFCTLYTSGTTGRPKGAMLTHLGTVHSVLHYTRHFGLGADERGILAVPASHVTGLVAIILPMLMLGGRVVILRAFKAARFLEIAAREGMTYTLMVPAMYALCLLEPDFPAQALSGWRVGGYGGAPMATDTIRRLAAVLPRLSLFNAYGATETTSPAVLMPPGVALERADCVGRPVACCDLLVMDDEGRELPPGEAGELWMAGPMVVPGYWNRPEADADAFVGGFWRSGDIGSVDAEGYVRILDRRKDMINRGGFKIYPAEVENVLLGHPHVIEAAVVGRPCPVLSERVVAFLRLDKPVSADELRRLCAEQLSDYKVPEHFLFQDDPLPRNANGKLLKAPLRREAEKLG